MNVKRVLVFIALLAMPMTAFAVELGIQGECSDCHTMHNSEQGQPVARIGFSETASETPIQNLLKFDCIACHANPLATGPLWEMSTGGSVVPQVSHSDATGDLAGGNFYYSTQNQRHGHNVIDLTPADGSNVTQTQGGVEVFGAPPGNTQAVLHKDVFSSSTSTPFDAFTCAGARGCHGTRSQLLTAELDASNNFVGVRRTGMAAISGAHHNSFDGYKDGSDYVGTPGHKGSVVAAGYRFIPGLKGYGNDAAETERWQNIDKDSHNEYFGRESNAVGAAAGCDVCHQDGTGEGFSPQATANSYLKVPGNDMSGFCATCHGAFHSMGTENGTSGAFLRHPSDWVIPADGEYLGYTEYDVTAPVARQASVFVEAMEASPGVAAGTDMVMCLSCHAAHATENDYMLRGTYSTMIAGGYDTIAAAKIVGFCLACHTTKGVLPQNRLN